MMEPDFRDCSPVSGDEESAKSLIEKETDAFPKKSRVDGIREFIHKHIWPLYNLFLHIILLATSSCSTSDIGEMAWT
jgi:hypothetical protein